MGGSRSETRRRGRGDRSIRLARLECVRMHVSRLIEQRQIEGPFMTTADMEKRFRNLVNLLTEELAKTDSLLGVYGLTDQTRISEGEIAVRSGMLALFTTHRVARGCLGISVEPPRNTL